jgi:hypothetical protein
MEEMKRFEIFNLHKIKNLHGNEIEAFGFEDLNSIINFYQKNHFIDENNKIKENCFAHDEKQIIKRNFKVLKGWLATSIKILKVMLVWNVKEHFLQYI